MALGAGRFPPRPIGPHADPVEGGQGQDPHLSLLFILSAAETLVFRGDVP